MEMFLKTATEDGQELVYNSQIDQVQVLKKKDGQTSDIPPGSIVFGEIPMIPQ